MQPRILIGIITQVGKTMLIFRPALKNECRSEENYSWSAKPAITSNGEHCSPNYFNLAKWFQRRRFLKRFMITDSA
jgi:hypothetical protein